MKPYIPKFTVPKAPPKEEFKTGLVSISFRNNTQREILEMMRQSDLKYIEWGSDVHAPHRSLDMLKELAEMQSQYGITASSYGTYFRLGITPTEELVDYIKAAKILGTDTLRLWAGTKCGGEMSLPEIEKFMNAAWRCAEIAERECVKLCLECHQKTFTERLEDALMLMENADSDKIRMYWQPFYERTVEENLKYLRKIEPYVEHIHVFNWEGANRYPLVDGIGDWKRYVSALSRPRTMLLEFMPDDLLTSLPREAEALREIIK